jgi:outer membrane protein OmpA-like peptidoglycan-associated protein
VRHYIAPSRIIVKGMGYEIPVASNESEQGRQQNRRVVFEIRK